MNKVPPGYKQTEVGVIPEDWEARRIGTFTDCTAGGTPSTTIPAYWGGSILWMSSGELNLKRVSDVEGRITEFGLRNSSTKIVPAQCVLVGLAGQGKTRGTVAMNSVELCTNQSIAAIFPNQAFEPSYLYYDLDSRYDELRSLSTGDGGRGGLNLKIIRSILVPFPKIKEQRAIAGVLSDVDALIAGLEALIAKKRDLKQATMQQLLTGHTRLPGFDGEWETKRLGEVGNCFAGGTPSAVQPDFWGGDIFWLPSGRVQNNILSAPIDSEITITQLGLEGSAAKKIKPQSVLVAITGATCANIAMLEFEAAANQSVVAIEPMPSMDCRFIYYSLLMERSQILSRQNGSAQGGVNLKTIRGIQISCPPSSEQTAIAAVLSDMDAEIAALEARRDKTRALKQGMMQELLTGRIRLI